MKSYCARIAPRKKCPQRIFSVLLAVLALLPVFALSGCADSGQAEIPRFETYKDIPGVTQKDIEAVEALRAKRPRLVYGVCESTEAFMREDGSIGGFAELFGKRLSELFGFTFDYRAYSWEDMYNKIISKEIDIVSDFTATPERLQKFLMTDAIIQRTIKIFTDINADSLSIISKSRPIRCAFMENSITYALVAGSWDMPFEPVFISDQSKVPDMLRRGEIDAFIEEGTLEAAFDAFEFVNVEEYYPLIYSPISLTTGNQEMAPVIDVVQKYLQNGGYYELTGLYNQGYSEYLKHKLAKQLTEEEKAYIEKHSDGATAILAACEVDNYPTSFYNKKEREFQGMALDTLEKVSELTGLVFKVGNSSDALWPELIGGLESGKFSIISELLRSSQREGRFIWADRSYTTSNYALLSKAEYPDININQIIFSKVGLFDGAAHTDVFLEWFPDSAKTAKYYESNDDAFAALEKGEIDLLMASQNMLLNMTNYQEKPGFKANVVFKYSSDSFFGFNKNEKILCSIVNKALRYSDAEEITSRWQRKVFDYQSKMLRDILPFVVIFVAVMAAALVVVFGFFIKNRSMNRNLEKLVADQTMELREQTQLAVDASQAKSDFLAKMSHEIRTPMNVVVGLAEVLQRRNLPDDIKSEVQDIRQAGVHLLSIINDILDFSKIEAGKMDLVDASYMLGSLLHDVENLIRFRIAESLLVFTVNVDPTLPGVLRGDMTRVRQILLNLLGNAIKFTQEGSVTLTVTGEMRTDEEVLLSFEVADTGIGIKPEDLEKIFENFIQADLTKKRNIEGTGLGLAISQNLCHMMGGEITVRSVYGEGSVFTAIIPQKIADAKPLTQYSEIVACGAENQEAGFSAPGVRILSVDDSKTNLTVLRGLLAPFDAVIDDCMSGEEAVKVVKQNHYDLIFMDHMMPGMDGVEAVKLIREWEGGGGDAVPIIALTANAISGMREMFLENGFNDFLSKPIEIPVLNRIMEKWIPLEKRNEYAREKRRERDLNTRRDASFTVEGLDTARGLVMTGGLEKQYRGVLELYCKDAAERLELFKKSMDDPAADAALLAVHFHAIKSASASIGADALSEEAARLESAGKSGDMVYIKARIAAFCGRLEKMTERIQAALLKSDESGRESGITGNGQVSDAERESIANYLESLKAALNAEDIGAADSLLKKLEEVVHDSETGKILVDIAECVLISEFAEAARIVDRLLNIE
jgi:signal transduction histidine kinase/CheY-like chemotaxis protein